MKKNVYQHIRSNDLKIFSLVCLFPITLIAFVYLAFFVIGLGIESQEEYTRHMDSFKLVIPWLVGICVIATIISVLSGDKMMLSFSEAKICPFKKEYLHVYRAVENIALKAGLPTPKVYIIPDNSLNAFATGFSPKTSSVALSKGLIEKLTPLELDAVIAHEMAHIKNRDIRLNLYVVTGIGVIGLIGELLIRIRLKRNKLGAILMMSGIFLLLYRHFIAPLIHMAVSRKQEFKADATGAFFTRNPEALASALEKISQDPFIESLENSKQMAMVCIYNPLKLKHLSGLLNTHPPINERIKRLRTMM